ncbi:T9SS type A sorting domain-containing protein [Hyunsoonleella flava]|uniref:T9SS type A sorting domain-containing protein n=1 Tax=Hyunsoonleella flava TaxID=2527939 RepID=A0A4Q9FBJ7_9FLAO|nr:T9SS type A sorting domain-containing protein [Hyunsoonleella flava]TBN01407.1 T9SS type A sorting domain-containing protein [Hyunsoonleella flava]
MKEKLSFQNPKSILLAFFSFLLFSFQISADTDCGQITGLEFSNGHETVTIENNGVYNINDLPEHFYIDLNVDGYSQSAKYIVEDLATHKTYTVVENLLPYTFPAGNGSWNLGTGTFEVKVNLYKFDHAFGFKCDTINVIITIGENHEPPCTADAGTITADADTATLVGDSVTISATPDGNINVPDGYSQLFVLTSTEGLVIEAVGAEASFPVMAPGRYTIHTLVYDAREDSPNFLDLGVVKIGETTGVDVLNLVGAAGICASLDAAGAPVMVEACTADAGTITADADTVTLVGDSVTISATPDGNINVPDGYSQLFVLTSTEGLVIEAVGAEASFPVMAPGRYTIHTLVYDAREDSPNFLDLGVVKIGETTGVDVLNLVGAAGICASLDAAGAPVMVEACTADAGTITADADTVTLVGDSVTISATPDGNINVPDGYSQLFVLTSTEGLVIEAVGAEASFPVMAPGRYTIHTLVYDAREDSPNFLDLGVVKIGETTGVDVLNLVGAAGICASLDAAGAPVMVEACTADAGTITADMDTATLVGDSVTISATPDGNINVPDGYSQLFVLTSTEGLVIEAVGAEASFPVMAPGRYTIHTLVYDAREDSPNFLDLGVVKIGETTGVDVLNLVGAAGICASLDAAGAPVMVEACTADAGTLIADASEVTLAGGNATLKATHDVAPTIPSEYSRIYVLTSGDNLVIEQVNYLPNFTVTKVGKYTIHTLIYDARESSINFLDLGIVKFGETTGVDVLGIVTENGLCASLDVTGAPVEVVAKEVCTVNAGTLTATVSEVCSTGEVVISAHPNGDADIPSEYSVLYVLTQGDELIIRQIADTPEFTVMGGGDYTIHTFVYPTGLDLSGVVPNETTGFDVNGFLIQGGGDLCASLDVEGAPVSITNPDAGTLTADESSVTLSGGSAIVSAMPNGDANVPSDYSTLYVLTQGDELVIRQIEGTPEFTVNEAGNYTIHTLVYPTGLDLSGVVPNVTTGFDVNGLLVQGGGELCASLDVAGAPVHVEEEPCTADAGTLHATESNVTLSNGSAVISAVPSGDANVPSGYATLYVLTEGDGLVIRQVDATPEFTVDSAGNYTIHTFVYPADLDLSIVVLGETTGFDVNSLLIQGGGDLCAALDVAGAPVHVEEEPCTADAGTLHATESNVTLSNGSAVISAVPSGDANVPSGYATLYVLTEGDGLVIRQVDATPEFTVDSAGNYTIHTFVYPADLDLSIVVLGETTGFDVNSLLIQGGGDLCAALDVAGAPIHVEEEVCNASSGKMYSPKPIQCLKRGEATLSAKFHQLPHIPEGYAQLYVLTEAYSLTILQVSATPEFTVDHQGFYRIHSLVYDPATLDLSVVQLGETTGFDVLHLVEDNNICASLDVRGAINLVIGSKWFCYFFNKYRARHWNNKNGKGPNDDDLAGYIATYSSYEEFEASFVEQNDEVRFYPNPVVNNLNVEIRLFENEEMNYNILDVRGRMIMNGSAEALKSGKLTIDTNQFAKGMYVVNFVSEFRTITKKIVIEK